MTSRSVWRRKGWPIRGLPPTHVPRPRLAAGLVEHQVVLAEAPAGYGKTMLAAEYEAARRTRGVWITAPGDVGGSFLEAVSAGLRAADLHDEADVVPAGRSSTEAAADAVLRLLAGTPDPLLIVVDELHLAAGGSLPGFVLPLVRDLPHRHQLLLLARGLPSGLRPLYRYRNVRVLDSHDLRFTDAETLALLRDGYGVPVSRQSATAATAALAGWPAAVAAAGEAARVSGGHLRPRAALTALVQEALGTLAEPDVDALRQLACLPVVSAAIAAPLQRPDLLRRAIDAGIPLSRGLADRWHLTGPVREVLSAGVDLDARVAVVAADDYATAGEFEEALTTLARSRDWDAVTDLLARLDRHELATVPAASLAAVVTTLPEAVQRRHTPLLLRITSCLPPDLEREPRRRLLDALTAFVADEGRDRRALEAERLLDRATHGDPPALVDIRRALANLEEGEERSEAVLREALGRLLCALPDVDRLVEAAEHFDRARDIWLDAGVTPRAAEVVLATVHLVDRPLARHETADRRIDGILPRVTADQVLHSLLLAERAANLVDAARPEEAKVVVEALSQATATHLADRVAWLRLRTAAALDDRSGALEAASAIRQELERASDGQAGRPPDLARVADELSRAGAEASARRLLEQAHGLDAGDATGLALLGVQARHGRPEEARALARRLLAAGAGNLPRDEWRVRLLDAYAAFRAGDEDATDTVRKAFAAAADHGLAHVPPVLERRATEELRGLLPVEEPDSGDVASQPEADLRCTVKVLGDAKILRGGRDVTPRQAMPLKLVKLLAAAGRPLHVEEVIESLWPESDPDRGRARLRTVLSRVRRSCGPLVERDGETITLVGDVDAARFADDARHALRVVRDRPEEGLAGARAALARYGGDLLPSDPYADWAAGPRERLRKLLVQVLDLLIRAAVEAGATGDALDLLERMIDVEAFEESHYLQAARLLAGEGRPGRAMEMLAAGQEALVEWGLPPSSALRDARHVLASAASWDAGDAAAGQ